MFAWLNRLRQEREEYRRFLAVPVEQRRVVFYSEGRGYWTHFEPVFRALRDQHGESVLYVTSDPGDPLRSDPPEGLETFCIGQDSIRTLFFAGLQARVLLMTMPDLHSFHIKRSPHAVHYVYLHHSMVSTHMIYRAAAFDHFDAVLCVGPHHEQEIRAREQLAGLPAKTLVECGYGRLDTLLNDNSRPETGSSPPCIIVAPSWGEQALLERHGAAVIRPLLASGFQVVLRPHPRTRKLQPAVLEGIAREFSDHPRFSLDEDIEGRHSLIAADLMISDWSGAALEFALGLERPVLFVDVPRKVLNPDYEALLVEPLEVRIRNEVGQVVSEDALDTLGEMAGAMLSDSYDWPTAIRQARERRIYNCGSSGVAAARYIASQLCIC